MAEASRWISRDEPAPPMNIARPIDAIRGHALSVIGPFAPSLLRDRSRRVVVYGLLSVATALALTFGAPMLLLAIGPLVLGVPHLVADVRYLVVRPGIHRRFDVWLFVVLPAAISFVHSHAWVSMLACVGAAVIARASFVRRVIVGSCALAIVLACASLGSVADIVMAHAHNAIAVAIFVLWSRRRHKPTNEDKSTNEKKEKSTRVHLFIVAAFVLGLVAITCGAFDHAPAMNLRGSTLLDSDDVLATLAPLSDPVWAMRLLLAFAFAQSVHYAVWVRLVPEEDRPRPGLRSFASSLRSLREDLGIVLLVVGGAVALGIMIWGAISITAARDGYLRLAVFHGPLELGAATLLLLETGRIGSIGRTGTSDNPLN
jgi:hypothetical protein